MVLAFKASSLLSEMVHYFLKTLECCYGLSWSIISPDKNVSFNVRLPAIDDIKDYLGPIDKNDGRQSVTSQ